MNLKEAMKKLEIYLAAGTELSKGKCLFNLFLLSGLCLLFGCAPEIGADCQFRTTIYGNLIKQDTLPLKLYVSPSFPTDYMQGLESAAAEINRDREYIQIGKIPTENSRNYVNEIYLVDSWKRESPSELAITTVSWNATGSILETDLLINSQYYNFREDGHSFRRLMVHELLHALGMKHQNDDMWGIMYPYTIANIDQKMTEREYKNLECAYGK